MKGWRTIAFNVLTGVAFALGNVTAVPGLDAQTLLVINLVGNGLLRFLTNTAVGQSN